MTYDLLTEAVTEYLHFSEAVEDKLHTVMSEGFENMGGNNVVMWWGIICLLVEICSVK